MSFILIKIIPLACFHSSKLHIPRNGEFSENMANILITKRTTMGTCLDYDIIRIRRENSNELLGNCFMHAFIENLPGLF